MRKISAWSFIHILLISSVWLQGCASYKPIPPAQLESIGSAVAQALPPQANVSVTSGRGRSSKSNIIISAHLLEGYYADDNSPYVRGDYGTHEKLERKVRYRCATIFKAVATKSIIPDADKVVIQVRHGVRHHYGSLASPGGDVATTIYSVSIQVERLRVGVWSSTREEDVMLLWRIESNVIPSLIIKPEFRFK